MKGEIPEKIEKSERMENILKMLASIRIHFDKAEDIELLSNRQFEVIEPYWHESIDEAVQEEVQKGIKNGRPGKNFKIPFRAIVDNAIEKLNQKILDNPVIQACWWDCIIHDVWRNTKSEKQFFEMLEGVWEARDNA
jgi:phosphoribosylformylglycinamidine (FGAM) synthase PurS component